MPAPNPASCQVKTLSKASTIELKAQLIEAHARLLTQQGSAASRTATLMRLGSFEVRLIQPLSMPPTDVVRVWMEIFDHDRQLSIDSVGNCVLEDAVIVAEDFIARATEQGKNPHAWRRRT